MDRPAIANASAAEWLSALERVFQAAVTASSMGGATGSLLLQLFHRRVRLWLAGPALRDQLLPAFAHVVIPEDGAPADLTVKIWDGAATRLSPPPPPWPRSSYGARSEVRHGFTDQPLEVSFQTETGTLEVFAAESRTAYCWVRDGASWPLWQRAAPLRTTLGHFARTLGGQLVHGAAVGTDAGAVLLSARGGSGKSTTALACLAASLRYLGDDYVFLTGGAQPKRVFSVYATAKLRREGGLAHVPELARAPWNHQIGEPKSVLYLYPQWKDRMAVSLPLRAVLIPSLSADDKTSLTRAAPREALHALAPTTLFQLPGGNGAVLTALAELLRGVPAYRLNLGPRPADAALLITNLLAHRGEELRDAAV